MNLLLAALLLLPAGGAWANQRALPRGNLAPVWKGPIVSALETLGPAWVSQQGLRCLVAFEKIRAENGFSQRHDVSTLEFLAMELRKRQNPEGFEELRKQPYLLGEALAEAAREAEDQADAIVGFLYSSLTNKTARGEDPQAEADLAQGLLELARPYVPKVSTDELADAIAKARDLQYKLTARRAVGGLAAGLRSLQAEGLPVEPEFLAVLDAAAGEAGPAPKEESAERRAAWSSARREGRDTLFDGSHWVSGGQPFQFFPTLESLIAVRLSAVEGFEAGPWSEEMLSSIEASLNRPELEPYVARGGGEELRQRLLAKVAAVRTKLRPAIEKTRERWAREAGAAAKGSHSLLKYGPIMRLARRYTSLQERSFDAQDHGLELTILERLWFGNPQEGLPSWNQLQAKLAAAERSFQRFALWVIGAFAVSTVPALIAKLAFPGTWFMAISGGIMFFLLAMMTWLSVRRTLDTFVGPEMRSAAEHFFRKQYGPAK